MRGSITLRATLALAGPSASRSSVTIRMIDNRPSQLFGLTAELLHHPVVCGRLAAIKVAHSPYRNDLDAQILNLIDQRFPGLAAS